MLKRINATQIRAGMFVESVEGVWLNTTSMGRRFLLDNETDAEAIRRSKVSGVFINTALGSDVTHPGNGPDTAASKNSGARSSALRMNYGYLNDVSLATRTLNETTADLRSVFENARSQGDIKFEAVMPIVWQIAASMERNPSILIGLSRLKAKDDTTYLHSVAVSALMIKFARYLKFSKDMVHILGVGGLVHDIGKIQIPTGVLAKPGALTADEMSLMRDHPAIGHKMLSRQSGMPDIVLDVCLNHHERIDGTGYPAGLKGDQISLEARMAAICDVYDAITSVRPYRAPWTASEAATWMLEKIGYFDRKLLRTHPRRAALLRSEANWMFCLYGRQYRQCENRGFSDREAAAS